MADYVVIFQLLLLALAGGALIPMLSFGIALMVALIVAGVFIFAARSMCHKAWKRGYNARRRIHE